MRTYDLMVLGGGTGNIVAAEAADEGLDVALVEKGPLGGTCLNRGCNPSKQLVERASVARTVRTAAESGIEASIDHIDFGAITDEVMDSVGAVAERKAEAARDRENVTFYHAEGAFVDERTVAVEAVDDDAGALDGSERLTAEKVVLAGGSRPLIPDSLEGTDAVDYLTNEEALSLDYLPDRLVIVGGGYIAVEMAHVYGSMGAEVTIVGSHEALVPREDRDVANRLTAAYEERDAIDLVLGHRATELVESGGVVTVTTETEDGGSLDVTGDEVLLATGRRPNSDRWNVEAGGIETDERGFVETDDSLATSAPNTWAIGDIAGNYMFKHSGDREARFALKNAVHGAHESVTYPGMSHAVFGSPQLASTGETEGDLEERGVDYAVGTAEFTDVTLGAAKHADHGLVKVLVDPDDQVLGCHVVGPDASTLIHEVTTALAAGGDAAEIADAIRVHPALNEVVAAAFRDCCGSTVEGL